jgi:hypothetical protein
MRVAAHCVAAGLTVLAMVSWSVPSCAAAATTPPADDDDAAALALTAPESAPGTTAPLFASIELAQTESRLTAGGDADAQRTSLDLRADYALAPHWRAVMSDHLDLLWPGTFVDSQQINTLKEAYLSWQQSDLLIDAGRINVRQGVGYGYNPTDILRADALRTEDSIDPNSLRMTRLGTLMLRTQWLWDSGAFTALYAPRLADHPTLSGWDPDIGATNSRNRWMLSLSQRLIGAWSPQWLVLGTGSGSPQLGFNTTAALGDSTIAYLELATGQSHSQFDQALQTADSPHAPAAESWHSRLSSGATYTFANKLSLTAELEYDGAALSRSQWSALPRNNPRQYGQYIEYIFAQQELPTYLSGMLVASWQDLMVQHLDLSAFVRRDLIDHSSLAWTELRYHWPQIDAAFRWQDARGGPTSDFGVSPIRQSWQLVLDYYL